MTCKFKHISVIILLLSGFFPLFGKTDKVADLDYNLSPYTGYTRDTWIHVTERILDGAFKYVDPNTGLFTLPASTGAYHELEDYHKENQVRVAERIYAGVLYYYLATSRDKLPGSKVSMTALFVKAYTQGTDPNSPYYWGEPEKADQIGATIVQAIYSAPKKFWDPLTKVQKDNLTAYLQKQSVNYTWPNNHHYFHLFSTPAIEKNGADGNREMHTRRLEKLLGWYRGDGWFIDGNNRGFDYYNFWGFQLFNQMILRYDPVWSEAYGDRIRYTSGKFMEMVPYIYSREDGHIPWGRSLTYRFASGAAIGWNIINGDTTLSPGLARRLLSGDLKYFIDHGAIGGGNKLLNIGYRGENQDLAERYIVPGDPYFAMHGLAPIILPADHPFWTSVEEPAPADGEGGRVALKGPSCVLNVRQSDGDARIYFAGQTFHRDYWQCPIKYMQHSYSARIGFPLVGDDGEDIGAGRTGYSYDGETWMYRWRTRTLMLESDHIASYYPLQSLDYRTSTVSDFERDDMFTHTLIGKSGEVHIFWHNYPTPLRLSIGGYAVCRPFDGTTTTSRIAGGLQANTPEFASAVSQIYGPAGSVRCIELQPREGWTNTHLFGGIGVYPQWESDGWIGPHTPVVVFVEAVKGDRIAVPEIAVRQTPTGISVIFEGKPYEINIIDK